MHARGEEKEEETHIKRRELRTIVYRIMKWFSVEYISVAELHEINDVESILFE